MALTDDELHNMKYLVDRMTPGTWTAHPGVVTRPPWISATGTTTAVLKVGEVPNINDARAIAYVMPRASDLIVQNARLIHALQWADRVAVNALSTNDPDQQTPADKVLLEIMKALDSVGARLEQ